MKSESDSKICPPELAVFIRDYHGVPSAARVLERNEYLLKETPPEKLREVLERFSGALRGGELPGMVTCLSYLIVATNLNECASLKTVI